MGLGFNITGNPVFDLFIVQSAENRDRVLNELARSGEKFINGILYDYKLTKADFTGDDWRVISQYLGDEEDGW